MDFPSFLCLETSPALILRKRKCHTNKLFVGRENQTVEYHTLFHQLIEQSDKFFGYIIMTKGAFYYIFEKMLDYNNIICYRVLDNISKHISNYANISTTSDQSAEKTN